ncbi:MAG: hypothetical protein AAF675_19810 [Pseudomonadota bacterium]
MAVVALLGGCLETAVKDTGQSDLPLGNAPTTDLYQPLNSTQVELFLRDSTLSHRSDEVRWHVYVGADGSLTGVARDRANKTLNRTRGRWDVDAEGVLCRQWDSNWGGGETGCAQVYQRGDSYVFVPPGSTPSQGIERRRSPGDAFNIL